MQEVEKLLEELKKRRNAGDIRSGEVDDYIDVALTLLRTKPKAGDGLAEIGERYMDIYERDIPENYHPANCPTEWVLELLSDRDAKEQECEGLKEIIREIGRISCGEDQAANWLELPDGGCGNIQTCNHDNDECPVWCIRQALALLRTKPKAGEFTKRFRDLIKLSEEHLSNNKIGRLRTRGLEACVLLDAKEQEIEKHRWIPVSERLPEGAWNCNHPHLSEEVLIANSCAVEVGFYNRNDEIWYIDEPRKKQWIDKITHWKPISKP